MTRTSPNILFLFPDQHRPDWLGCNSDLPLRTPNLDKLVQRGVRFTRAFTPSPLCSPARACLALGRDYAQCGVQDNGQNTSTTAPNYYRNLRDAGYNVAGVGKFDLHKPDWDWGLDGSNLLREYGFTAGIDNEGKGDAIAAYRQNGMSPKGPYMQYLKERGWLDRHLAMYAPHLDKPDVLNYPAVTTLPDEAYCDNWVADNAARFLRGFPLGKPWHLVVNFVGPHGPFDVTAAMRERWRKVEIAPPVDNHEPDVETVKSRRQNYAAMIENIDMQTGRLIDLVAQRGERDNTLVVYSSDHGEMLGDHGLWGKCVFYTPSSGIPLIVAGPGVRQGATSDALVALHDLAATFLECGGAEPLPDCDARSLVPVLRGERETHRASIRSGLRQVVARQVKRQWRMVFDGRYKLVVGANPPPLLYDVAKDPHELTNIADRHPEAVNRLMGLLETEGTAHG